MEKLVTYPTTCLNKFLSKDGFCTRCSKHHFKFINKREMKRGTAKGGLVRRRIFTVVPGTNRVLKVLYPNNLRPADIMNDFFESMDN